MFFPTPQPIVLRMNLCAMGFRNHLICARHSQTSQTVKFPNMSGGHSLFRSSTYSYQPQPLVNFQTSGHLTSKGFTHLLTYCVSGTASNGAIEIKVHVAKFLAWRVPVSSGILSSANNFRRNPGNCLEMAIALKVPTGTEVSD